MCTFFVGQAALDVEKTNATGAGIFFTGGGIQGSCWAATYTDAAADAYDYTTVYADLTAGSDVAKAVDADTGLALGVVQAGYNCQVGYAAGQTDDVAATLNYFVTVPAVANDTTTTDAGSMMKVAFAAVAMIFALLF